MKKRLLIVAGVITAILLSPRRARAATSSPKRSEPIPPRWRQQIDAMSSTNDGWRSNAPAWALPLVVDASRQTGIPAVLLAALIRTESAWQPYVVSAAGAIGLAQLMPATAAELGVDPWNPADNVRGGARYLRTQLDAFDDVSFALAAYNAGPHRVRQYGGVPPFRETQAYVARILERVRA
jgi:soluble lytic murein transglycosylase-like protein